MEATVYYKNGGIPNFEAPVKLGDVPSVDTWLDLSWLDTDNLKLTLTPADGDSFELDTHVYVELRGFASDGTLAFKKKSADINLRIFNCDLPEMPLIANMDKPGLTVLYKEPEWPLNFNNEKCTNEGSLTYHIVHNDGTSTEFSSGLLSLTTPDVNKPWEFSIETNATAPPVSPVDLQVERRLNGVKVERSPPYVNQAEFTFEIVASGSTCTASSLVNSFFLPAQ